MGLEAWGLELQDRGLGVAQSSGRACLAASTASRLARHCRQCSCSARSDAVFNRSFCVRRVHAGWACNAHTVVRMQWACSAHAVDMQCTRSGHAVQRRRASASLHRACSFSLIAANLASLAASSSCRPTALAARCRARAVHASVSASCHPPGARRRATAASTSRATAACVSAASSACTSLSTAAATARCRSALCAVPCNRSPRSPLAASSRAYIVHVQHVHVHTCARARACACAYAVHTSQQALHICLSACLLYPLAPLQPLHYSSTAHPQPHLRRLGSHRIRHKAGAVQRRLFGRRGGRDADVPVGGGLALDASVERAPQSIRTHRHLEEVGRFRTPGQLIYTLSAQRPIAYR